MDDFENISLKSFRGGISPDGDKGPRGSFKFGKNLDIHGGRDTLKSNQRMKVDAVASGHSISDLPLVIIPTSDGSKFAFGDTGKIYRKKAGEWKQMANVAEKISGAVEFPSTTGRWLLFATATKLKKILLRHATNLEDWTDRITDVGNFAGAVEGTPTFSVTKAAAAKITFWQRGIINPSGSVPPELSAGGRNSSSAGDTSISINLNIPNKPNQTVIVIAGDYSNGTSPASATIGGSAMTVASSGGGGSGAFNINYAVFRHNNPTPGNNSIVVTLGSSRTNRFIYAFVFEGVNQANPLEGLTGGFPSPADANPSTIDLATTAANQARYAIVFSEQTTFTHPNTQIKIADGNTGTIGNEALYYRMPFVTVSGLHPMRLALGHAVVADGPYIGVYDFNDAFNNKALTLPPGLVAADLLDQSTESTDRLIIGCKDTGREEGWIVTWDGVSDSWLAKKPTKSDGVNVMAFLEGGVVLQAGDSGELKYWNYGEVYPLRQIPGVTVGLHGAKADYRGMPHFGLSGDKGGVYSVGRKDNNHPIAVNLEFMPSHGRHDGEIGALGADGDDIYACWKYVDGGSPVYGIDVIDHANKAVSVYESLELDMNRADIEKFIRHIKAVTEPLPENASVTVKYKSTRDQDDWKLASMGDEADLLTGTGRTKGIFDIETQGEAFELQVTITPSGNNSPEIRSINSLFNYGDSL